MNSKVIKSLSGIFVVLVAVMMTSCDDGEGCAPMPFVMSATSCEARIDAEIPVRIASGSGDYAISSSDESVTMAHFSPFLYGEYGAIGMRDIATGKRCEGSFDMYFMDQLTIIPAGYLD